MKIAHVIQSIDPRFGGPSAVVMRLAAEQARLGAQVSIVTESSPNERRCFNQWIRQLAPEGKLDLVLVPGGWITTLVPDRQFRELHRTHDILHVHGVWNSLVARCLSGRVRQRARVLLAPHGMLTRWSLDQKKLKKSVAWTLWLRSALQRVDRFHALNRAESLEIHERSPGAEIVVLPNGTERVATRDTTTAAARRYIMFLARLHPVKGPDRLVEAFARGVRDATLPADVDLVLAGPDFGMLPDLRARASRLGIADRVKFPGAVYGTDKTRMLSEAIVLCQPSRHEAFSLTLLEALAHGVPAIATPESNFPEMAACGAGLIVDGDDVAALSSALGRLVADSALRQRMGDAGRLLVGQNYTWDRIAERALQVYQSVSAATLDAAASERLSAASTVR